MSNTLKAFVEEHLKQSDLVKSLPPAEAVSQLDTSKFKRNAPPLHPQLVEAMNVANDAFFASDVGINLSENALQMTPQEVMQLLPQIVSIPEIQALAEMARGPNVFAEETVGDGTFVKQLIEKYAPESVLIQFCATTEVVDFGGTVYIGFALDLQNLNTASLYVGGSLGLGVGAIVAAGQGVGLTSNAYSGVTGTCIGVDAAGAYAVGGLIDLSCAISFPYVPVMTHISPSSWTLVAYFIEGLGAGVEAYGGFTLKLIDQTLPNIYQAPAANSVDIYSINCIKREDTSDHDEIHFYITIDDSSSQVFRYPLWDHYSIAEDETWGVGFTVNFNSSFKIDLYESSDIIHSWTVTDDDIAAPGNYITKDYNTSGVFTNDVHYEVKIQTPAAV